MKGVYPLIIVGIIISFLVKFIIPSIVILLVPIGIMILILCVLKLFYLLYSNLYFKSRKFLVIKESIQKYINNCNDLNNHLDNLKSSFNYISTYDYGDGNLIDESKYKFKRQEWRNNMRNRQVHNCSANVCKNASNQPIKYLCKYFNIEKTEITLINFENTLNDFAAAEQGKMLLKNEVNLILSNISGSIPKIIMHYSKVKLMKKLGFETFDFSDLYFPVYTFQYVSAGGNSSTKFDIKLNIENLEKLIFYLNDEIKFRKSNKGQRALMTSALREKIKIRDNFSCKKCSLSINDEKNLLLEIDHIIPISKGGLTSEDNLQTLCWRCNRSKGSKIVNM